MATTTIPVNEEKADLTVALEQLHESPYNARRFYNEEKLKELSDSIKAQGIIQPIVVRTNNVGYEIVAGSRRFRAAKMAGLTDVPIRIKEMSDEQAREVSLIENLQREDVHPMHEAIGMQDALQTGGYDVTKLAARLGKHEAHVYRRLQLCRLIEPLQEAFLGGIYTLMGATGMSKLTVEQQTAAARHFGTEREWAINERDVQRWIDNNVLTVLGKTVFDQKDANLVPEAGACVGCTKRTGASPILWENEEEDKCTDPACFRSKIDAFLEQKRAKLVKRHGEKGYVTISDHYRGRSEGTILGSESYAEADKGSCEFTKPGLVVEGEIGKTRWVCIEKTCKEHHRHSPSRDGLDKERQKQAEKATALRGRVFKMVLKKYPETTSRKLKEFIAVKFANRLTHDVDINLAKLLQVETGKGMGIHYPGYIAKLTDHELDVFMLAIALAPEAKVFTYGRLENDGPLFEIAKDFGVEVDAAENYTKALFDAKTKKGYARKDAMMALPKDPSQ